MQSESIDFIAVTHNELLHNYRRYKKYKIPRKIYRGKYDCDSVGKLCPNFFKEFIYYVLLDVINNNVIFNLPEKRYAWNRKRSYICIEEITGDELKEYCQCGRMKHIDLFNTNFIGYELRLVTECENHSKTSVRITLINSMGNIMYDNINSGKLMKKQIKNTYFDDYLPIVYEVFPDIDKSLIRDVIRFGLIKLINAISDWRLNVLIRGKLRNNGKDIFIHFGSWRRRGVELRKFWRNQMIIKLRYKCTNIKRLNRPYYWYFSISKEDFNKEFPDGKIGFTHKFNKEIVLYKSWYCLIRCVYHRRLDYFFKTRVVNDDGFIVRNEDFTAKELELIAVRDKDGKLNILHEQEGSY